MRPSQSAHTHTHIIPTMRNRAFAVMSPGVDACIRVAAQAPVPGANPAQDLADFLNLLSAGLANSTAAPDADNHTGMSQGMYCQLTRLLMHHAMPSFCWLRQLQKAAHSRRWQACVQKSDAGQGMYHCQLKPLTKQPEGLSQAAQFMWMATFLKRQCCTNIPTTWPLIYTRC